MRIELSTLERANRAEAFSFMLNLKTPRYVPTPKEIDLVLNYFAPPKGKIAKSAEEWVALACDPKDTRPLSHYVHVKNGEALATNGKVMFWALTLLADGTYDPKTLLPVENKKLIPNYIAVKNSSSKGGVPGEFDIDSSKKYLHVYKTFETWALDIGGLIFDVKQVEKVLNGSKKLSAFIDKERRLMHGVGFIVTALSS